MQFCCLRFSEPGERVIHSTVRMGKLGINAKRRFKMLARLGGIGVILAFKQDITQVDADHDVIGIVLYRFGVDHLGGLALPGQNQQPSEQNKIHPM